MAKETMSERNSNPFYYEVMSCRCGRTTDLLKHKYSEEYSCVDCVNKLSTRYKEEKEREEEELCRHDDYRGFSYNQLLQERNA